jgi:WD40 repeat protein
MRLWDVATGLPALTVEGHADRVSAIVFSRDGRRLATVGIDKTVKVWDTVPADDPKGPNVTLP